jgi:hypothetical protein
MSCAGFDGGGEMASAVTRDRNGFVLENSIEYYRERLVEALPALLERQGGASRRFDPGLRIPEPEPALRDFFSASDLAFSPLGEYRGKKIALLDLARNPATRTTKTFASLLIVARAVRFIQVTGEPVMIITPSSANKATAMRDAVHRAIDSGLVTHDQLRVTVVVPRTSAHKLWESELHTDAELRARNPVAVYAGPAADEVKALAQHAVDTCGEELKKATGVNLWHTLDLNNYVTADVIRAFAEAEFFRPAEGAERLHVHAVSSAFGLLGHAQGHALLDRSEREGMATPHYFLVQHLGTPDMVLSLYRGSSDREGMPKYSQDPRTGLYIQESDPRFPFATFDPRENLDPTFYTRRPATSPRMNELIRGQGGGGIVVSLHECLARYAEIRALLQGTNVELPADPREMRESSLIMAVAGLLHAVDRELVPEDDILVHGSGSYSAGDYVTLPATAHNLVEDGPALRDVLFKAADA